MGSRYRALPSALQMVTSINEAGLLAAPRNGETALDTLYRAHAEQLFRTVHRITRNRDDAEDAVQDSFLRAFLHLKGFDERSTFYTRLTRIGVNSALMILRQKRNSHGISAHGPGVDETPWEVPDSAPNPEMRCAERERERFLRDTIAGLRQRYSRRYGNWCRAAAATGRRERKPSFSAEDHQQTRIRRALEFHTFQDHSLQETAAQFGISVSAAKALSFHAKAALRKSKVLRKINRPSWHGLHTRLDRQRARSKE
jgi:RNA polymerase sigma factor (sigma-70 family)